MTDEIIDLVTKKHLVVVHGDSGSGKSSIVRAGVLVQLQQGHAATDATWRTCAMLPREDALG
jgi:ABC-type polar amino acid transport system ATPase subunit